MKKRCLKFITNERLCRYLRWGYHFYTNPFISPRWVRKKEVFDTFVLFFLFMIISLFLFVILVLLFTSLSVEIMGIFNPLLAALMMVQSALIYGMIFGLCLRALTPVGGMKFYIQVILQSLRLYAMLMPVFATLFWLSLLISVDELFGCETSLWLLGLNLAALGWVIWLQYDVIIRPVVRYLSPFLGAFKSVVVTTVAFLMASVLWQLASIPYRDAVFDESRFLNAVVASLHKHGEIDTFQKEALRTKIRDGNLHQLP